MAVKGRRTRNLDEPTLLKDVNSILDKAKELGYVNGYEVDIENIASRHPDLVLQKDFDMDASMSGSLTKDKEQNKWVIRVNGKHHKKRQRFTIAHEFAHFILHKDDQGQFVDEEVYFRKNHDSPIEFNADKFAAELLMPEDIFRKAITEDGIKQIKDLSDEFNVSKSAIIKRAEELGFKTKSSER